MNFTSAKPSWTRRLISMCLNARCAKVKLLVGAAMDRCRDDRKLSELDPVTFFIVTELMQAEREQLLARLQPQTIQLRENFVRQVA